MIQAEYTFKIFWHIESLWPGWNTDWQSHPEAVPASEFPAEVHEISVDLVRACGLQVRKAQLNKWGMGWDRRWNEMDIITQGHV